MPYIGKEPEHGNYQRIDTIASSFNGSTTTFNLRADSVSVYPTSPATMIISLGGVVQEPDTSYTVSGDQITFTTAPASGTTFWGVSLGDTLDIGTVSDGSITAAKLADDAVNTDEIVDDAVTADKLANSINAEIAANTAKTGITSSQASAITANTAKVTNATHTGDVTGATSLTIANGAVDIAHLSASGSAGSGTFLRGDNAWAAVAASAISREGGTTSEATTTSTSAMDLITMSSLTIAAASPWTMTSLWRKTTGHASAASGGLKIVADSTVVTGESTTAATLWQSGTANQAEDGGSDTVVGAKATNYLTSNSQNDIVSRNSSSGGFTYGNVGTLTKDAVFPVGQTTSIVLRANSGNASVTTGSDEIHVYVLSVS